MDYSGTQADPWSFLRSHTAARIAQGRVGHGIPTTALLDFQLDHARARDAVYNTLDFDRLFAELTQLVSNETIPIRLRSQAPDRPTYLKRPDWGRQLHADSHRLLTDMPAQPADLCIVLADGLSATAINQHTVPMLKHLLPELSGRGWTITPLCVVEQGRVAIADQIAHALNATMTLILIGERPGLTSPDSLGAYLTYAPRPGLTDEARNCVSNIRPQGLPHVLAAQKLLYLLTEMRSRKLSGVGLKDEMGLLDQ